MTSLALANALATSCAGESQVIWVDDNALRCGAFPPTCKQLSAAPGYQSRIVKCTFEDFGARRRARPVQLRTGVKAAEDCRPLGTELVVHAGHAESGSQRRFPRAQRADQRRGYDAMAARLDDLFADALSFDTPDPFGVVPMRPGR